MKLVISENSWIRRNPVVREKLREVLTRVPTYSPGTKKDIMLLSSRRSGSTWLMECLGCEPGLRTLNEPFGPKFVARSVLANAPDFDQVYSGHRLFEFTPAVAEQAKRYLKDPLLNRLSGPYNPFSPSFHFRYDRTLWKVIHANPAIQFFYDRVGEFHTILLLRHPCPTILSMQKKYLSELDLILSNDAFCEAHLSGPQRESLNRINREGSLLQKFAAEWGLEQLLPLKKLAAVRDQILVLSYEALLDDPKQVLNGVCQYCELDSVERILRTLQYPSASTAGDRMKDLKRSTAQELIHSWRRRMSVEDENRVFDILDLLGVDTYLRGQDFANPVYCAFGKRGGHSK